MNIKKEILLVDDDRNIQRLLHFILSEEFEIGIAANGYEAFMSLEHSRRIPDLIIMDWLMPQMDGRSFLNCLKVSGLYADIPVIVLSASEDVIDELGALSFSINRYLHKPFDPFTLKECIADIFDTRAYGFTH